VLVGAVDRLLRDTTDLLVIAGEGLFLFQNSVAEW
jgi:hypothetical protein